MNAKKFIAIALLLTAITSSANAATCTSISQYGITWTFNKAYKCGQFANGDYWVIGPVTIIGIIPASVVIGGRTINGAMLDQLGNSDLRYSAPSGFDSAGPGWNSSLNVARPGGNDLSAGNPLIIGPNHSLISAISVAEAGARPQLSDAAILTILGSAPEPNSFRPPYSGTDKTIKFKVSNLDYNSLGSLATVTGPTVTPYQPQTYSLSTVEGWFERPWLDFQRFNDNLHPSNNMPGYGKGIAKQTSIGALTLQLNYTNAQKKTLMIRYAQLGIDLYGVLLQTNGGIIWEGGGAQSAGRKLPILFAGAVLNDADMKGIGNLPFHFGEDDQTFYVTSRDVYAKPYNLSTWRDVYTTGTIDVNYGETKVTGSGTLWSGLASGTYFFAVVGDNEANLPAAKAYKVASFDSNTQLTLSEPYRHSSVSGGSYKLSDAVYYGHAKADKIWQEGTTNADWVEFEDDDIGIPYWGIEHATDSIEDGKNWYTNYVHDNAAIYCGTQLSTLIMGLKTLWNHNAFFDYTDRWMTTEVGAIRSETDFSENMWDAYRANYGCIWTRDDSSPCTNTSDFSSSCYSQGHYNCSNCLYNCLSSPYCGDGTCNGNEDSKTCAWDCKSTQCTTDSQCSSGQKCCNGICRRAACTSNSDCNAGQQCINAGQCDANCQNTECSQGAITSACYCQGTVRTTEYCCNGIYKTTACTQCIEDSQCSAGQKCCDGVCITPACLSNAECNDNNSETSDSCENPASCESYCKNEPLTCGGIVCIAGQICCNNTCTTPACTKTSDCDDSDACTRDSCTTAGTCTAQCSHTAIPKCGWKKMNWTIASCFPIAELFTVTVKDETGIALEGVEITYGTQKMFTNAEGKVEMLGEKSQYTINATKEGYYPLTTRKLASTTCKPTYTTTGTTPTTTAKGKIKIEILEIPYIGRQFKIKITDNNNQAVQGATITYSQQTAETNEQGQATLTAEKSKYIITATTADGSATARILPKTQPSGTSDQNKTDGTIAAGMPIIPLDVIALAAIIIIGIIILLKARKPRKNQI